MPKLTQGMLLAAGLSTRMRPLTNTIPKPLVPFLGRRILDFTLQYLQKNGIEQISVNVHHGRAPFLAALKENHPVQMKPFEEDPILGTGGGIKNMRSFITEEHFVVTNCDFFTDVDVKQAFEFHLQKKSLATMVLVKTPSAQNYAGIGVNEEGRIVDFPYGHSPKGASIFGLFSGIHIFHQDIFKHMPEASVFDINKDVYSKLIENGLPAYGWATRARWIDVGEVDLYYQAETELKKSPLNWMK